MESVGERQESTRMTTLDLASSLRLLDPTCPMSSHRIHATPLELCMRSARTPGDNRHKGALVTGRAQTACTTAGRVGKKDPSALHHHTCTMKNPVRRDYRKACV
ncbi:hypothetical protein DPEC_G00355820 [Dallia pectoralis]|uniref:Uncharacterized protein n=1 Tax=Dallia pectoralis TaxID=75939 RepID=A0ACC2EZN1_DALPE|nr:hypothetical protein DPEC_G00355820 [Dallia pectoralis]